MVVWQGRFRLRARYFCRQTKVPKNWLRNLRFLRTSLGGGLVPAFLPIRRSWSNTCFSRVLSHPGGDRSRFLPTTTAGPGQWPVARRGAHCVPTVDHGMTREYPFRRPPGGGCRSFPKGPGAASIGGLSCVLLRRAGQIMTRPLPAAPVTSPGVRGTVVWRSREASPTEIDYHRPPAAFSPIFGRSKMGPRPPSFVLRPS